MIFIFVLVLFLFGIDGDGVIGVVVEGIIRKKNYKSFWKIWIFMLK